MSIGYLGEVPNCVPLPEDADKTHLREWVAALRSGKYKKGKNQLATRTPAGSMTYCCFGVAAEISPHAFSEDDGHLTRSIEEWLVGGPRWIDQSRYVNMNDEDDRTFEEIADQIEKDYDL